jgi:hydroxyacylglutathione hydrolase
MRVAAVPAFEDNYIFCLLQEPGTQGAVVVDPGEAPPVLDLLERERLQVEVVLVTHHHRDHVGGLSALLRRFPGARVVGPAAERDRIRGLTETVKEGDALEVAGRKTRVLDVPGHTAGHVAYYVADDAGAGDLFSGDTVFGGTIGNLFEGTPDDMFAALVKIRALPPATRLWCAHEYTLQYVREAARFDPANARLAARLRRVEAEVRDGRPTVPLRLEEERATNPFFRWDDPDLVRRLGTEPGLATFRRLCELL